MWIKIGRFTEVWNEYIADGKIPKGTPNKYCACIGQNPYKEGHAFDAFVVDGTIFISDYGRILEPTSYKIYRLIC